MAEERITVRARIDAVESSVRKQKVVRDRDSEKRVKQELREKLKAEGTYENMKEEEFQSLYRKQLRSYAPYIDGRYTPQDEEDGGPGLLASKLMWENELRISYRVGGKDYTQTVAFDTETKCLEAGHDFYITVAPSEPQNILYKSLHDPRGNQEDQKSDDFGCLGNMIILGFILLLLYFFVSS